MVVSRYILRDDIREHGSGNAGLTNFYRVFGGPLTAVVILSDVLKAVAAVPADLIFPVWTLEIYLEIYSEIYSVEAEDDVQIMVL